jgi:Ca2+/Na+ antiporter
VFPIYIERVYILIIVLVIVAIISLLFWFCTSKYEMPNYPMTICFFTLVLSLIWIWFTANILISLLMTIANLMNIPDSFLGMTILTYGNSVPDLMLNLSLVKLGYGEMALSGSIAGPLFNLLMGLGLPLLKLNLKKGGIDIVFFDKSNIIGVLCLVFLFVNLIALGLQARCAKYHLNIKLAVVRFIFYVLFFVLICFMIFLVK